MAKLSDKDLMLDAEAQKQILAYKDAWAKASAAGDQAAMDAAHAGAEAIRSQAGYSGGSDGGGVLLDQQPQTQPQTGGQSAADVQAWVDDYHNANYGQNGWNNGYSTGMNLRSMANYIRQQMDANSKAWSTADAATKQYLHDQNQQLAKILQDSVGGAESVYNEQTGRWETYNSNLGYGTDMSYVDPNLFDPNFRSSVYGQTEADWEKYRNDTDRYYNFVDTRTVRNWNDESSGFTGQYAQFINGPYTQLLSGTKFVSPAVYQDVIGDGFGDEGEYIPVRDAQGNIIPQAPQLKNNNASDYTRALAGYTENGVIMPNVLNGGYRDPDSGVGAYGGNRGSGPSYATSMDEAEAAGDRWIPDADSPMFHGDYTAAKTQGQTQGAGGLEEYLRNLYAANLESQKAQLEAAYQQNLSQLDASLDSSNAAYTEQKRQTTGTAEQQAANWKELANSMGLNSGAMGQAALAQSNQLQSNLNALNSAQAAAQAEIDRQRALLGQQYQLAILEAQANNDFELANALYNEAVRQDEALRQQEQFNAQMELQYAQMAQSMLGTLLSNSNGITLNGGLSMPDVQPVSDPGDTPEDRPSRNAVDAIKSVISGRYSMSPLTSIVNNLFSEGYSSKDIDQALAELGL